MPKTLLYAVTVPDYFDPARDSFVVEPPREAGVRVQAQAVEHVADLPSLPPGVPRPALVGSLALIKCISSVWVIAPDPDDRERTVEIADRVGEPGRRWAVVSHGDCLSRSGQWSYEPSPSGRTDQWKAENRFATIDECLAACRQAGIVPLLDRVVEQWLGRAAQAAES